MLFKEKDYKQTDARHTKTNQNSSPRAFGSGELTKMATKQAKDRKVNILSKFETFDREINIEH